jgi:hypothetical protein
MPRWSQGSDHRQARREGLPEQGHGSLRSVAASRGIVFDRRRRNGTRATSQSIVHCGDPLPIGCIAGSAHQMAEELTDLEIAVLCDLLEGPHVNLKAHRKAVLDQLIAKGLVEPVQNDSLRFQLSSKAHHVLAERGVGMSGG